MDTQLQQHREQNPGQVTSVREKIAQGCEDQPYRLLLDS